MQVQLEKRDIEREKQITSIKTLDIPLSAKKVLEVLYCEGPMTSGELEYKCSYSDRTIRNSLKKLIRIGLVRRVANFHDMRTSLFHAETLNNS